MNGRCRVFAPKHATAVFGEAHFCTLYLTCTRLAPKLPEYFTDLGNTGRADRMPLGQETAAGIDRAAATKLCHALVNKFSALAGLAQAQLLIHQEFGRRGRVVSLDNLEILRPKPGLLVCLVGD